MSRGHVQASAVEDDRRRRSVLEGIRDVLPAMVALFPFGTAIGVAIAEASVSNFIGWVAAPLIFAGSGHVAAVSFLGNGVPWLAAAAGIVSVNMHFAVYSASFSHDMGPQPRWFRLVAPYFLIEPVYAVTARRLTREDADRGDGLRMHYLGAGVSLWLLWLLAIAFGILIGPVLPANSPLEFILPLLLLGLLVPTIASSSMLASALVAAGVALPLLGTLGPGAVLVGGAAGVVVGVAIERRSARAAS